MRERKPYRRIASWLAEAALDGADEAALLSGFCEKLNEFGWPIVQGLVLIDTLHPLYEGRVFRWRRDDSEPTYVREYGHFEKDNAPIDRDWKQSPFYQLDQTGETILRRKIRAGELDFPVLKDFAERGFSDYVAMVHRFRGRSVIGPMDRIHSSWSTDAPEGFSEEQITEMWQLVAQLVVALRGASVTQIAETLAETYLGHRTGHRVLDGSIQRGTVTRAPAVVWFSDLKGSTSIADASDPEEIIPLLNDYAEVVISSVHEAGGEVLKLMGDGVMAIFRAGRAAPGCHAALMAERILRRRVLELNARRASEGHPVTIPYVALHVGEVFYGNIGAPDRLDFTVVGPTVNEASRIAGFCGMLERDVLLSTAFHEAASARDRTRMVSVGRYALRGVSHPQELYTIYDGD